MPRAFRIIAVAAAASIPLALLPAGAALASGHGGRPGGGTGNDGNTQACPAPESLVSGTTWTSHALAPGVRLQEGVAHDRTVTGEPGTVDIHVLHVNPASANVAVRPLERHLAQRSDLSSLASGRSHLVAATNTGYFDFDADAPDGPVFDSGYPTAIGAVHRPVVGFTTTGAVESATAWLAGTVHVAGRTEPVAGYNYLRTGRGLAVYSTAWGSTAVPFAPSKWNSSRSLVVRSGHVAGRAGRTGVVPAHSELLVASTAATERWLESAKAGQSVVTSLAVRTTAAKPMVEGYSTGLQLVTGAGTVESSLGCNEMNTQAARTAVGITSSGALLVVVVADHIDTTEHGLDHKEMARLMVDLGAVRAWEWDGSGSSEMIARLPGAGLSIRNWCADGRQRPMPVGLGIYSYPQRLKTGHHNRKKK